MERNPELQLAWEYAEHTGISIFLTGKAGTGKTTFMRTLRERSAKSMVVVAPTGVAAINAGGTTIHSFFQLPTAPYVPGSDYKDTFNFSKQKLRIIRALDLLVIDEISMVRADLLDAVDNALRKYRRSSAPFGGVQLLMIGDLLQLAPVVTHAEESLLRTHYDTNYFFGSKALACVPYVTISLSKVYRQQNEQFVELLNHVRTNAMTPSDVALLNSRLNPDFRPGARSGYIRLTTHNATADDFNRMELARLVGTGRRYGAEIAGVFPEYAYPTAVDLYLKVGAQVMFVKNDPSAEQRYFNGKIGIVTEMGAETVTVACEGEAEPITIGVQQWDNMKYTVDEKTQTVVTETQGSFTQIPLRLAWAITIHKSQGLTFDRVIIDAGRAFAPGQVYVALSRCKTLDGIVLTTPLGSSRMGTDPEVAGYIGRQNEECRRSVGMLPEIKQAFYRNRLLDLFNFGDLATTQASAARLMGQTFRHSYSDETAAQGMIATRLREEIIDVADKWIVQLTNMPAQALSTPDLLRRVGAASAYFAERLQSVFGDSVDALAKVKTGDKKASQRIHELALDLRALLKSHCQVLKAIAAQGFTIPGYLRIKQQALLEADKPERKTSRTSAPTPQRSRSASGSATRRR